MNQPLNQTDTISLQVLQYLSAEYEALAYQTKALQRSRQVRNPSELLHLVFLYSWLGLSSRLVAARFSCLYRRITDSAVLERLGGCREYLHQLIIKQFGLEEESSIKDLGKRYLITLVDGSSWGSRGGRTSDYRLHLKLSWRSGGWTEMLFGDNHLGESLLNYSYRPDELVVADRNYGRPRAVVAVDRQGVRFVVRISPSQIRICDESGEVIEWGGILDQAEENQGRYEQSVWISEGVGKSLTKMRVVLGKLPPEKALLAEVKARRKARHRGGQIRTETLRYAHWLIVLSNLSEEEAGSEELLQIYRMRWQVEIGIKRLKSLYRIDQMSSSAGSPVGEVRVLARLLMALMIGRKLKVIGHRIKKVNLILSRKSSGWRENIWHIKEFEQEVWGEVAEEAFEQAISMMKERRRKYRLQRLKKIRKKKRKRSKNESKL